LTCLSAQIYVIDHHWFSHTYDVPRAIALLSSIHRAIIAFPGTLPNVEFSFALSDKPEDHDHTKPIWVLSRTEADPFKWVMPDFGYWSWPLKVVGEYTEIRRTMRMNEPVWEEKTPKALWRGATGPNAIRLDLIKAAEDKEWSDIEEIHWTDPANINTEGNAQPIPLLEHCNYQYLVHTEGNSYSGRAKHLLNCNSVSIVHKPEWWEPHTHLFEASGPGQNFILVERNFTDLDAKISHLIANPAEAKRIAANSVTIFRDRYLTPAAQACYWRRMLNSWAKLSFEPDLYYTTTETSNGKPMKKLRGTPYETFIADLIVPDTCPHVSTKEELCPEPEEDAVEAKR
jgi:hypothetical protein